MIFSKVELEQYKRHLVLDEVGYAGQTKLKTAKVLCVGAGGLGSSVLYYLAAAGVGNLGIVDGDKVDISNLQRQILFNTVDIGKNKAIVAKERLALLNPHINFEAYQYKLTSENAEALLKEFDIIVDCTDNFETRYLINRTCVSLTKVFISGSVSKFKGQCTFISPSTGPCLNCLYPADSNHPGLPNCSEGGVLGVLPGLIGTIQATEIVKYIAGVGVPLVGKVLAINALDLDFELFSFSKDPTCEICNGKSKVPYSHKLSSVAHIDSFIKKEDLLVLREGNDFLLIDVRMPDEHKDYNIGGVNIPLADLHKNLDAIAESKLVILYCQSGERSRYALSILNNFGIFNVKSLAGGINTI